MWWPGTESNRRRQPFQGCALPAELPGQRKFSLPDSFGFPRALLAHFSAHGCLNRFWRPDPWDDIAGLRLAQADAECEFELGQGGLHWGWKRIESRRQSLQS